MTEHGPSHDCICYYQESHQKKRYGRYIEMCKRMSSKKRTYYHPWYRCYRSDFNKTIVFVIYVQWGEINVFCVSDCCVVLGIRDIFHLGTYYLSETSVYTYNFKWCQLNRSRNVACILHHLCMAASLFHELSCYQLACYYLIVFWFYYPRPVLAFGYCRCLRLSVCVSVRVRQPLACPRDNLWPVSARITKFGP